MGNQQCTNFNKGKRNFSDRLLTAESRRIIQMMMEHAEPQFRCYHWALSA